MQREAAERALAWEDSKCSMVGRVQDGMCFPREHAAVYRISHRSAKAVPSRATQQRPRSAAASLPGSVQLRDSAAGHLSRGSPANTKLMMPQASRIGARALEHPQPTSHPLAAQPAGIARQHSTLSVGEVRSFWAESASTQHERDR